MSLCPRTNNWAYFCAKWRSLRLLTQQAQLSSLGKITRIFCNFCWAVFGQTTSLDQSHASEIIWWIIMQNIVICQCNCLTDQSWLIETVDCTKEHRLNTHNGLWLFAHSLFIVITVDIVRSSNNDRFLPVNTILSLLHWWKDSSRYLVLVQMLPWKQSAINWLSQCFSPSI